MAEGLLLQLGIAGPFNGSALHAGLLGLLGASSLLLGAAVGYWLRLPHSAVAGAMAFAAGVLLALVSFDLIERSYQAAGLLPTSIGFIGGVALFTGCNQLLIRSGGQHRKRSGCNPCERQTSSAGLAIALGTLLDGVPESFVVGVSTLGGGHQSALAVAAFFLANFPEALSSTAGMKQAGRTSAFIFGLWGGIVAASAAAAAVGHYVLAGDPGSGAALALGVAGGAIVAMVVDTMLPEATDDAHRFTGIVAAAGFLAAFILSKTLTGE